MKKMSYKEQKIKWFKNVYESWTNTLRWKDDINATMDYCDFCEMYNMILEGLESLSDNPTCWIQMSINSALTSSTNKMSDLIMRSGEK